MIPLTLICIALTVFLVGAVIAGRDKKGKVVELTHRELDTIKREAHMRTKRECPQCEMSVRYTPSLRCVHCNSTTLLPLNQAPIKVWFRMPKPKPPLRVHP